MILFAGFRGVERARGDSRSQLLIIATFTSESSARESGRSAGKTLLRGNEGIRKRRTVASFSQKIISSRKEGSLGESGAFPWKEAWLHRRPAKGKRVERSFYSRESSSRKPFPFNRCLWARATGILLSFEDRSCQPSGISTLFSFSLSLSLSLSFSLVVSFEGVPRFSSPFRIISISAAAFLVNLFHERAGVL